MPPAFNLSQDQTLQFDLLQVNSINVGPIPRHFCPRDKTFGLPPSLGTSLTALCEHFVCLGTPRQQHPCKHHPPGPQTTSTHTYRLRIVKEQAACDDVDVSAAAPRCRALA